MAFNEVGNSDLDRMNALNQEIYHRFSYEYGPLYEDDWITSHTVLEHSIYGDGPRAFVERMGVGKGEWNRVGHVSVLRSCVMHPWIAHNENYPERFQSFLQIIQKKVGDILESPEAEAAVVKV